MLECQIFQGLIFNLGMERTLPLNTYKNYNYVGKQQLRNC